MLSTLHRSRVQTRNKSQVPMTPYRLLCIAVALHLAMPHSSAGDSAQPQGWIEPGSVGQLAAQAHYDNEFGRLAVLNIDGPVSLRGNAFFEPLGSNGRACVTCHQPRD